MRLKRRCEATAAVFFQGTDEGGFTASLFCAWSWLEMDGGGTGGGTKWRDKLTKVEGQNSCPSGGGRGVEKSQKRA